MIPVNEPLLNGNEKKYLAECIDTGWISSEGPFVKRFEDGMSAYVNRKHGIAVANGTVALELAIKTLNLQENDEVIIPSFTIISCALCLVRNKVKPVLVDSDLVNWNMDISQIENKINKNTKAIMVVHIYGLPVNMDPVIALAKKYNLKIIEDAAEMHGQTYKDKKCGSFGDISIFSFYPNKHITTGEGGMLLCDDDILAERAKSLRNLCFKAEKRFEHDELGYNYRITNIQAAIGVAQLERIDSFIQKKRWIGSLYTELLANIGVAALPLAEESYSKNIYWVYGLLLNDDYDKTAESVMNELKQYKIGTRPFFYPMHKQPVFQKMGLFENESYPNAEKLYKKGFYVPSGLAITEDQIRDVSNILHKVLK